MITRLVVWCQRNRLSINVKKTKLVFYPASQNAINDVNNVINMQGTAVDYVSSYLYLGIWGSRWPTWLGRWHLLFGLPLHGFEPCKQHLRKMDLGVTPPQKVAQ